MEQEAVGLRLRLLILGDHLALIRNEKPRYWAPLGVAFQSLTLLGNIGKQWGVLPRVLPRRRSFMTFTLNVVRQ